MTATGIEIIEAGISVVTDLGRYGYTDQGLQINGAADQFSAIAANILVGNDENAPIVELTSILPFQMRTPEPVLVSVTGATGAITIDGLKFAGNTPIVTWPHALIRVEPALAGLRGYIAIHGDIEGDKYLGSYAHDSLINRGRKLVDGDCLNVEHFGVATPPHITSFFPIKAPQDSYSPHTRLGVVPGPELDEFPDFFETVSEQTFTIGGQSDHAGIRLEGMSPGRSENTEILSRGVPVGAIEVPPAGGMIALLRGRPLTAGYPVPAVVARGWHPCLAQLRPGDCVSLISTSVSRSLARAQKRRDELDRLRRKCTTAFTASRIFASRTMAMR